MVTRRAGLVWQHVGLCAALWLSCAVAHADKVHLAGGSVIEGKVQRVGDKIVIELDSGSVRLEAASVVRIEKGESTFERVQAQRAALPKSAVAERLALANICREDRLPQCERELLREILAIDADHTEARVRLGYVRTDKGWITREEEQRARQASVRESALALDQAAALRRAELARDTAELTRQQAELALETQRLALRTAEAQQREAQQTQPNPTVFVTPYLYSLRPPRVTLPPPAVNGPAFGINGVRDPASYFH